MPSAKSETRSSAPPEKTLRNPSRPPAWVIILSIAAPSTPGTGIWHSARNTAIASRVNRMRLRSSRIERAPASLLNIASLLLVREQQHAQQPVADRDVEPQQDRGDDHDEGGGLDGLQGRPGDPALGGVGLAPDVLQEFPELVELLHGRT